MCSPERVADLFKVAGAAYENLGILIGELFPNGESPSQLEERMSPKKRGRGRGRGRGRRRGGGVFEELYSVQSQPSTPIATRVPSGKQEVKTMASES
ncbi:hypothetical protein FQA39_LY05990 [Lamprigera yunnana]|nr:hypothetical protein FQA39_LY05990 [Lamprigera yunnana]